jgi:hypothetical protein
MQTYNKLLAIAPTTRVVIGVLEEAVEAPAGYAEARVGRGRARSRSGSESASGIASLPSRISLA